MLQYHTRSKILAGQTEFYWKEIQSKYENEKKTKWMMLSKTPFKHRLGSYQWRTGGVGVRERERERGEEREISCSCHIVYVYVQRVKLLESKTIGESRCGIKFKSIWTKIKLKNPNRI